MKRWGGLLLALLSAAACGAPGDAAALFAACPAGPPQLDVLSRRIDASLWRGPVLAVFWSTDCGFCRRHNERLNRLLAAEPGAAVLGIAVDDDTAAVQAAVSKRGYAFPVIQDGCRLRAQLTPRKLVPMTCWLGTAPKPPQCMPGEMTDDDLRDLLRQARSSRHS